LTPLSFFVLPKNETKKASLTAARSVATDCLPYTHSLPKTP